MEKRDSENSSSKVNSDSFSGDESLKKEEEEKYKIERNLKEQTNYNYDISIKLIVLGDSYVGKSSVIKRICLEKFDFDIQPTISIDVQNYFIKINEKIIKIQIWDTAGQEAYRSIAKYYYKNTDICLLIYSVDDIKSLDSIKSWYNEVLENNEKTNKNEMISILLGNKKDVDDTQRKVTFEKGEEFAKENNFFLFKEISCKSESKEEIENINEILNKIGKYFYEKYKRTRSAIESESLTSLEDRDFRNSNIKGKNQRKKKNCC